MKAGSEDEIHVLKEWGEKTMEYNQLICETRTYTEKFYTHSHSYSQLILPLQGSLSIKTGKNELSLNDNHLFFLPPQCDHSYHSVGINKFLVLDIPRDISLILLGDTLKHEIRQNLDERWKAIRYLLQEEVRSASKRGLYDLVKYACSFLLDEVRPTSIQYIHSNFHKSISIGQLAAIESFNESYYIEWFHRRTGMTPNAYIQKLRLQKAKEYLVNTDLSLLVISDLVGYKHQSSLTRLFMDHGEVPPREYRKKSRETDKSSPV